MRGAAVIRACGAGLALALTIAGAAGAQKKIPEGGVKLQTWQAKNCSLDQFKDVAVCKDFNSGLQNAVQPEQPAVTDTDAAVDAQKE